MKCLQRERELNKERVRKRMREINKEREIDM